MITLFLTRPAEGQHLHMNENLPSKKNIFLMMMDTMMQRMDNATKESSIGREFISQMIPHHEGAVSMAQYEIMYGQDFGMIQLAKSILAEQSNELLQMKLWLNGPKEDTIHISDVFIQNMEQTMNTMMKNMPQNNLLVKTDVSFALVMLPHHQAAIDMAKVALKFTLHQQTCAFAKHIISSEQIEIEQMSTFLKNNL